MAQNMELLGKVVELLQPLSSEDRGRLVRAAMAFLGEEQPSASVAVQPDSPASLSGLPPKAAAWMRQNGISADQLQEAFHINGNSVDVIASLPGRNKKEQTYSAYIIAGIGQLLVTGEPAFDDKTARSLCERSGCYDSANHSAHVKDRGNEFTGTKEKGWTLTAPGLKRGAELIKQMQSP